MVSVKVTSCWFWALLVLGGTLFAAASLATAAAYFNSSEPGCDGSDPNVLKCDDFEDGVWYATNCNQGGTGDPNNDGWCGTIYANPITPPNAAVCGGVGAAGTNCTATHGVTSVASGGRNMADHALANNPAGVSEIYVRFYTRLSSPYGWSDEKVLTFNKDNPGSGGIWFGHFVLGGGTLSFKVAGTQVFLTQNQGNAIALVPGRWYYVEARILLNTVGQSNGAVQLWANDCGATGVCTGTPTLRLSHTAVAGIRQSSSTEMIRVLWWENWGQDRVGSGERYIDQIKVSKVGPIGFMGGSPTAGAPPASPTSLTVQ